MCKVIKYNTKTEVEITFTEDEQFHFFKIADSGLCGDEKNQSKIFDILEVESNENHFVKKDTGIELSTLKKLVKGFGGKVHVESLI
jgi:light-regulated signal transduction histidine kinase (bacteriophytochrome)